ncbi:MAG: hypothetical protein HZC28_04540 [Spirochaetes bacterium]|nr:hypothetical protein [Spirochaetota bacterium]
MATKKKETQKAATADLTQFLDEIKLKAQDIYLERQRKSLPGDALSDWLKAEAVVKKAHSM